MPTEFWTLILAVELGRWLNYGQSAKKFLAAAKCQLWYKPDTVHLHVRIDIGIHEIEQGFISEAFFLRDHPNKDQTL
ncbi:803_t:CDS:2 [Ambispora leptoticha]|uniref:803_t:CDS:1 n=1 Tax=Ambispora leptoticha TaxID=144679 RepID=A0A9N9G5P6_9GLOM|nr:803_t:CDS:2 [Ambispora leptoticha]